MAQPLPRQTPKDPGPNPEGWWKIETEAGQSVDKIQAQFRAIFESAGSPAGAALFCNHVLLDRPTLFVTPEAVSISETLLVGYAGTPCAIPMEGILLVGNDADRNLLPVPELTVAPAPQP